MFQVVWLSVSVRVRVSAHEYVKGCAGEIKIKKKTLAGSTWIYGAHSQFDVYNLVNIFKIYHSANNGNEPSLNDKWQDNNHKHTISFLFIWSGDSPL